MRELIERIRTVKPDLSPGLDSRSIEEFERALGAPLPADLVELYRDHNGMPPFLLPMRSLSSADVIRDSAAIRNAFPGTLAPETAVFWTDDNSNYAGVFLSEPLSHRVFFLDHEEPDDSPRFRSVHSLVSALVANPDRDWCELSSDYPFRQGRDAFAIDDRTLSHFYLEQYRDNPVDRRKAFIAMALLPLGDTGLVLPLLKDADPWVQERACETVGFHGYAPGIALLADVARTGHGNGRIASIRALQRIGSREARLVLSDLSKELGEAYAPYFRDRAG